MVYGTPNEKKSGGLSELSQVLHLDRSGCCIYLLFTDFISSNNFVLDEKKSCFKVIKLALDFENFVYVIL